MKQNIFSIDKLSFDHGIQTFCNKFICILHSNTRNTEKIIKSRSKKGDNYKIWTPEEKLRYISHFKPISS